MTTSADSLLSALRHFSSAIASDRLLVQGAGGNVSVKWGDSIFVKASGEHLADALKAEIFLELNERTALDNIQRLGTYLETDIRSKGGLRPSIETPLHVLMPHPVVVHLHAVQVLAQLVKRDGERTIATLLGADIDFTWVPYARPGKELAEAVAQGISANEHSDVLMLESHGLVIGSPSFAGARERIELITGKLEVADQLTIQPPPIHSLLALSDLGYGPSADPSTHLLAMLAGGSEELRRIWPICPDQVVFLGEHPHCYSSIQEFRESIVNGQRDNDPPYAIIDGCGVVLHTTASQAQIEQLFCFSEVLLRQDNTHDITRLSERQIKSLVEGDDERYRVLLAAQRNGCS